MIDVEPGHYVHLGLERHVRDYVTSNNFDEHVVNVRINVDGVPIYKDSSLVPAFWIIQGDFGTKVDKPFIIGAYGGKTKPKSFNEFLMPLVDEFQKLKHFALDNREEAIAVRLQKVMADAPAKSSVMCIKGHNGYFACPRCVVEGKYLCSRMCYSFLNADLRTDESFRSKLNEEHHTGRSCLEEFEYFDSVKDVVIDYMHVALLGTMKRYF